MFSDTEVGSSKGAAGHVDPEFVAMYEEAAAAQGMTIAQYLEQLQVFPEDEIRHPYGSGNLSSDLMRSRIYQQKCEDCIIGT